MQTYQKMKDSGVDWLGDMPERWQLSKINAHYRRKKVTKTKDEELLSVYRDYGVIPKRSRDDNHNTESEDLSNYQLVEPDDLVTNKMKTWQGSIAISTHRGIVSPAYYILQPTSKKKLYPQFVHYLLRSKIYISQYQRFSKGIRVGQWDLEYDQFKTFPLLLPDYETQKRIADFIDNETAKIDSLISKQEKLLELIEEKRIASLNKAVTKGFKQDVKYKDSEVEWLGEIPSHWDIKQIKHLSMVKRGASPRPIDDPAYFDDNGEFNWVRIADVTRSGKYLESTPQKLSELGSALSVKQYPGDLFISIAASVGKPMITKIKCCIHDGFVYFSSLDDRKVLKEFLFYLFAAGQCYLGLGKMGTQLNLNTETIGSIKIGLPPISEQKEIIERIRITENEYEHSSQLADRQIQLLKERRVSLISHAVTGKIRV